MVYRDQMLVCEECGQKFVFRVEEQRSQEALGFEIHPPRYCVECRQTITTSPGLRAGVVKWYREDKHFGFIVQIDGSEVFFHRSGVEGDTTVLQEGSPVWYEVIATDRGPQAINVHGRERIAPVRES
ncbi:MAG: cold shock domain-containing protein [Anaerolineae bacterium]|nr:cold shock domain-containing protein [Anaerolineae bacterium]